MTLEDLKKRCEEANIRYAYGKFDQTTPIPHLVAIEAEPNNFNADNRVYKKKKTIKLDYTYKGKNIEEENKIEDEILHDVCWNKTDETYLSDEKVWQTSYFFEII